MQFTLAALLSAAALATAQVTYDPSTNTFTCAKQSGAYCASSSLKSNIIIRCNAGKGQPGNCNDNLAGIPPIGVKTSALCYESSSTAADAACSFNGIVYPDGNSSFPVPPAGSNGTQTGGPTGVTSTPIGVPTATLYTTVSGGIPPPPAGTGPAGTGSGGNGGAGSTGTGGPGGSNPSATWAPTGVPSQTPLPTSNAGAAVKGSWALLPAAGFLAFLL